MMDNPLPESWPGVAAVWRQYFGEKYRAHVLAVAGAISALTYHCLGLHYLAVIFPHCLSHSLVILSHFFTISHFLSLSPTFPLLTLELGRAIPLKPLIRPFLPSYFNPTLFFLP